MKAASPPDAPARSIVDPRRGCPVMVRDLGMITYGAAYDIQKQLQQQVIAARDTSARSSDGAGYMLLLEHAPAVITVSRRPGARSHLVASEAQLRAAETEVVETDRGGDITWHGPGQLVVYPILDLNALGLRLHGYMRFLEQIVIDVLGQFGICGQRDPDATGVWVSQGPGDGPPAKICAMGVRLSRWVSMHGLALNVIPDLSQFNLIVPCGLAGRAVTSMHACLGDECPDMIEVKRVMTDTFTRAVESCGT